jgi:hypothetical protein
LLDLATIFAREVARSTGLASVSSSFNADTPSGSS